VKRSEGRFLSLDDRQDDRASQSGGGEEKKVGIKVDSKFLVTIMRTSSLLRRQGKEAKSSLKDRRNNRLVWVPVSG
jgi:hypothetical protein